MSNNIGDRAHPYLKPIWGEKRWERGAFMMTKKFVFMQAIIQPILGEDIPSLIKINLRNS